MGKKSGSTSLSASALAQKASQALSQGEPTNLNKEVLVGKKKLNMDFSADPDPTDPSTILKETHEAPILVVKSKLPPKEPTDSAVPNPVCPEIGEKGCSCSPWRHPTPAPFPESFQPWCILSKRGLQLQS